MGASITFAHGCDKALGDTDPRRRVAFIGDSTFFHSGITGLINTVYNQSNVITIISDNRTTGMTGHQNHPGTGQTLMGKFGPVIKPEDIAKACGVKTVVVVDPYQVKATKAVVRELLAKDEPAVIINRRACALHIRLQKPPLWVDPQKCNGCEICISLGCPALTMRDDKAQVDETVCVGCGMCADVCPKQAIAQMTKDEGPRTKSETGGAK
jgi:indolepyruvate ferredoxin oxidoreductase alpha subunit